MTATVLAAHPAQGAAHPLLAQLEFGLGVFQRNSVEADGALAFDSPGEVSEALRGAAVDVGEA